MTFLLSYTSEKYPIGPWPNAPAIVEINKSIEISKRVKLALVAYTEIREKNAACINPVAKELKVPNGEILYNS